jgi:hypothetical protein
MSPPLPERPDLDQLSGPAPSSAALARQGLIPDAGQGISSEVLNRSRRPGPPFDGASGPPRKRARCNTYR